MIQWIQAKVRGTFIPTTLNNRLSKRLTKQRRSWNRYTAFRSLVHRALEFKGHTTTKIL